MLVAGGTMSQTEWSPERIRALRKTAGLSQAEMARHLEVAPHTLVRWENGKSRPTGLYASALERFAVVHAPSHGEMGRMACFASHLPHVVGDHRHGCSVLWDEAPSCSCYVEEGLFVAACTNAGRLAVHCPQCAVT